MQPTRLIILALLTLTAAVANAADVEKRVKLTSTEWPPYTGANLPGQGFLTSIARQTFSKAGYELQVDFSAWQRSLATAFQQSDYQGTLLVYYSRGKEASCHLTKEIGTSLIGFVQRKDTPVAWSVLKDLTGVRIGSVAGYFNTAEFDQLAETQVLDVSTVHNDLLNLRRVAFGRVELAVIDKLTMQYLLQTDPSLKSYRSLLEFNPRPLTTHSLHLCFNKTDEGRVLRDAYDKAFDPQQAATIAAEALSSLNTK